jgi:uncharacterized protein (DUF1499 family)
MWISLTVAAIPVAYFLFLVLNSWTVRPALGLREGRLTECPSKPNCVCSLTAETDAEHSIRPFSLGADPEADWARLRDLVTAMPRIRVVESTDQYLRAEYTSLLMRYVDDLEFHLRPEAGRIDVRSSSRVGYSDLGANRARVESIRAAWDNGK